MVDGRLGLLKGTPWKRTKRGKATTTVVESSDGVQYCLIQNLKQFNQYFEALGILFESRSFLKA